MMKTNTVVQEAIEKLGAEFEDNNEMGSQYFAGLQFAVDLLVKSLPKEREQIENIVDEVLQDANLYDTFKSIWSGEDYFKQTFNQ